MRSAGRAGGGAHRSDGDVLGGTQVEGRQAVRELLLARRRRVHQVLVSEATTGPLADLAELARTGGVPVHASTPWRPPMPTRVSSPPPSPSPRWNSRR
jgi:hypothetical protein